MVPRDGIEPPTRGFSVLCSTITIEDVRFWPNAVISEHEIKRLPNVRFFAKKIFAPRNQFPIGALRNPNFYQMIRPE